MCAQKKLNDWNLGFQEFQGISIPTDLNSMNTGFTQYNKFGDGVVQKKIACMLTK